METPMKCVQNVLTVQVQRQERIVGRMGTSPGGTGMKVVTVIFLVMAAVLGVVLAGCGQGTFGDTIKSVRVGFTNIYFIPCNGGLLQIDCGYPGDYEEYFKKAGEAGVDPSDVRYLLLTHHHDDHAGFAAEFVQKNDAAVIVHEKALGPLATGASVEDMRPVNGCVKTVFSVFSVFHGGFTFPPFVPREKDFVIAGDNGDNLKNIGIDGVIISTPGHTDDSISVVLADGSAIVGDVAMNFLGVCGLEHRPIYIKDIEQVYASWKRLREFGAVRIYPSHGGPFAAAELVPVR